MFLLLAVTIGLYGTALLKTMLRLLVRRPPRDLLVVWLALSCVGSTSAAVDEAVVLIDGGSGVCVDPTGLVLTAKHCELPGTVTVRFKDRTATAVRVYVCPETEGPVVYDCDGEGYPSLPVAASPPQFGERLWSYGYPDVNGQRCLRWASGRLQQWSTFEYAGGNFNGNIVGFATAPGWSGGPLLNAKGEVCGLLNSTDGATSVFISSAAVREAYAKVRQNRTDPQSADGRSTLLVFGSASCGPCRTFKADYESDTTFRATLDGAFRIEFVDVDRSVELANRYGVTEVPTFLVHGGVRRSGYESPGELLEALGLKQTLVARPPSEREVPAEMPPTPEVSPPAPTLAPVTNAEPPPVANPSAPPEAIAPSDVSDRLDRLSGLVQTAVSVATWLGVGGATGGVGGLVLGGLALFRTLRRRKREAKAARDPPPQVDPPPVVTIDSPPPPQAIVPETRFAPYERDTFAEAFAWAQAEMARKYPGSVGTLESIKGLMDQFLAAKGVRRTP
ncbi:MAG: trypsin-like peptidase domain-containing protein [Planctomycetaceae bacterium]